MEELIGYMKKQNMYKVENNDKMQSLIYRGYNKNQYDEQIRMIKKMKQQQTQYSPQPPQLFSKKQTPGNPANIILPCQKQRQYIFKLKQLQNQLKSREQQLLKIKQQHNSKGICVMCLDKFSNRVNQKCGHLCLCQACAKKVKMCPLCRTNGKWIEVFSSQLRKEVK